MNDEKEGHHRGRGYRRDGGTQKRGAKTFRRGRAIAFLDSLNLKRSTIKEQLEKPEFQSIHPILVGELKALDMVIKEFIQLFDIHETEGSKLPNHDKETESTVIDDEKSFNNIQEGTELNETN